LIEKKYCVTELRIAMKYSSGKVFPWIWKGPGYNIVMCDTRKNRKSDALPNGENRVKKFLSVPKIIVAITALFYTSFNASRQWSLPSRDQTGITVCTQRWPP
jgi:hypothetical protein